MTYEIDLVYCVSLCLFCLFFSQPLDWPTERNKITDVGAIKIESVRGSVHARTEADDSISSFVHIHV